MINKPLPTFPSPGSQLGPPLGLLPALLLSQHILGRLSAGEARCLCKATSATFDAGCTKLVTAAYDWNSGRYCGRPSNQQLVQLVLGMPALEELQLVHDVSASAQAQLLSAAAARNRGQLQAGPVLLQ